MATIHVIKSKDATTMTGMEALTALYEATNGTMDVFMYRFLYMYSI